MKNEKLIKVLSCSCAFSIAPTMLYGSEFVYEVMPGDTLSHIAESYAIDDPIISYRQTLELIKQVNPDMGDDFDQLYTGQQIKVPTPAQVSEYLKDQSSQLKTSFNRAPTSVEAVSESPRRIYQVKKGDTLSEIAREQVSQINESVATWKDALELIQELNPDLANIDDLSPGQKLFLPMQEKPEQKTYTVEKGDSISNIAEIMVISGKYPSAKRVELEEKIVDLNPEVENRHLIYEGQILSLPAQVGTLTFTNVPPRNIASEVKKEKDQGTLKFQGLPKKPADRVLKQFL